MYLRHACRTLLPVVAAGLVAFAVGAGAQDEPGGRRRPGGRPGIGERGPGDNRRLRRPQARPTDEPPAPMQVVAGKLYIVTGSTVRKLDVKTLEEESTAVIPVPVDAERQTKAREKFMERFDKDGDGFVREDEMKNPAIINRFDADGDGAISVDEVPAPQTMMRRPTGPVTLLVVERGAEGEGGSDLYVYRDGWLYSYDTADLTLQAQNEIAPRRAPERPPIRKDRQDRRDKRKEGRKQKDAPDPPPPPELPDEPVRF